MYNMHFKLSLLQLCTYTVITTLMYLRSNCEVEEDSTGNDVEVSLTGLVLNVHPHRPHLKLPLNFTS